MDDTFYRNIAFGLPEEEIEDEGVIEAIGFTQLDAFGQDRPGDEK